MKTKKDFTPEIRNKISEYKKACVEKLYNGDEWKSWKRKNTVEYVEYVYRLGKQKEKPVVIIADSLIQYRYFYNLLFNTKINKRYVFLVNLIHAIKNKKRGAKKELNSELYSELNSELDSELNSELDSELNSELRSELYSELNSELDSELRSELHSELDSELYSELRSELDSELDSELHSELNSELRSELNSELHSELNSELHSELHSELNSELHSELNIELDSELNIELDSELRSELRSELHSELDSELHSELDSELNSELNSELSSELDSELDSELRSELSSELNSELSSELYSELSSELDSELYSELTKRPKYHFLFLLAEYSRVYLMWYKFIKDEFKLKTKKGEELDWLYYHVNNACISKVFLCKKICLVLRMPKEIKRNNIGIHDTTVHGAIRYEREKLFYINGRKIPSWVFDKYFAKTLTFKKFQKESNEDIKAGIITLIKENEGSAGVLKFLNATMIDEQVICHKSGHTETVRLYKTKDKFSFAQDSIGNTNVQLAWTEETCPSTGQVYMIETCPTFKKAIDSIKFHRPKFVDMDFDYNFTDFNN